MSFTWDPLNCNANLTLSNGDLTVEAEASGTSYTVIANWAKSTGKWYWEIVVDAIAYSFSYESFGVCSVEPGTDFDNGTRSGWNESWAGMCNSRLYHDGSYSIGGFSGPAVDDILMFALDCDNGKLYLGLNGSWLNSANPAAGTNPHFSDASMAGIDLSACCTPRYDGDIVTARFASVDQTYPPPSGFVAIESSSGPAEPDIPSQALGIGEQTGFELNDGLSWDRSKTNVDVTLSNSGLTMTADADDTDLTSISGWQKDSGKWYWEIEIDSINGANASWGICFQGAGTDFDKDTRTGWGESWAFLDYPNLKYHDASNDYYNMGGLTEDGDILMFALDINNHRFWIGINGVWPDGGDPANGTNPTFEDPTITGLISACATCRYTNDSFTTVFYESDLNYSLPSGFSALDGSAGPISYEPSIGPEGLGLAETVYRDMTWNGKAALSGIGFDEAVIHNFGIVNALLGFADLPGRTLERVAAALAKIDLDNLSGATNAELQTIFAEAGIGFSEIAALSRDISPPAQGRVRFNEQAGAFLAVVKPGGGAEVGGVGLSVVTGAAIADSTIAGATVGIGFDETATRINDLFEAGVEVGIGFSEQATRQSEEKFASVTAGLGVAETIGVLRTLNPVLVAEGLSLGETAGALNYSAFIRQNSGRLIYRYFARITGAADGLADYEFPSFESAQIRMRTGSPSYLSLVVPYSADVLAEITARQNGELVMEMAAMVDGETPIREELIRAAFEYPRYDRGAVNQSITLTGYKTHSFVGGSSVLENVVTAAMDTDGTMRYRCAAPDFFLKPGHIATVDGESFTVDMVTCVIGPESQYMDVSE